MLGEQEAREAAINNELVKITRANPNAVPLYIIIHSKTEEVMEQPLTLCNKDTLVKDLLLKLHKKYPKYKQIYLFGRQGGQESRQDEKSRKKGKWKEKAVEEAQKILPIQERLLLRRMEEIHNIYKDQRGLLVMIISETALLANKKQPLWEPILLLLAVIFGLAFLYLSFTEQQPVVKSGSEIDYIV